MMDNPKVKVIVETLKDFARWALVFFVGWVIDNGYAFFAQSKMDPQVILVLGFVFKYADYYWHKYNKEQNPERVGESMGIIPF